MTISQTPSALKMERRRGADAKNQAVTQVFSLDGKEDTNAADRGRSDFTSKAGFQA